MISPTIQLDLSPARRVYVATFPDAFALNGWLLHNPLALRVCRAPGLLMFPGQVRAVIAEYVTPADHAKALETLQNLESVARRQYLRASQAKVRLNKLTPKDADLI